MSCIKEQAMTEPLVDIVDQRTIVTESCRVLVCLLSFLSFCFWCFSKHLCVDYTSQTQCHQIKRNVTNHIKRTEHSHQTPQTQSSDT